MKFDCKTLITGIIVAAASSLAFAQDKLESNVYLAPFTSTAPVIDGQTDADLWDRAQWQALDQRILGALPSASDFQGRFKIIWNEEGLFLLAEIVDDVLLDKTADPLKKYWDDDCLEFFLDEDASGGLHQFNYNAFAYHVALDNQTVDYGPGKDGKGAPGLYNEHIKSRWSRDANRTNTLIWELAITVFPDTYTDAVEGQTNNNKPVKLSENKILGFMLAYCDNDGSSEREHFMGSHDIQAVNGDKNRGYIDASVFGKLKLVN